MGRGRRRHHDRIRRHLCHGLTERPEHRGAHSHSAQKARRLRIRIHHAGEHGALQSLQCHRVHQSDAASADQDDAYSPFLPRQRKIFRGSRFIRLCVPSSQRQPKGRKVGRGIHPLDALHPLQVGAVHRQRKPKGFGGMNQCFHGREWNRDGSLGAPELSDGDAV